MTYSVTRRFQFCAGHRVYRHESKCAHPHGHNYVLYATFVAKESLTPLDALGRVIDFSLIKAILGSYIDSVIDHGFLWFKDDEEMFKIFSQNDYKHLCMEYNPTAENIGRFLLEVCKDLFKHTEVKCVKIKLYETENCFAEVT